MIASAVAQMASCGESQPHVSVRGQWRKATETGDGANLRRGGSRSYVHLKSVPLRHEMREIEDISISGGLH